MSGSVSVIIPAYNAACYIEFTLRSILEQTCPPQEIIIVEDGSRDGAELIAKRMSTDKIPIRYLWKNNGGCGSARNRGLDIAQSDYIAFLDADDLWENDKLEKQLAVFEKSTDPKLGLVYCGFRPIDANGNLIPNNMTFILDPTVRGNVFNRLLTANLIASSASGVLIKRDCFQKCGVFDETLTAAEDWDMWLRIAKDFTVDYCPESLVRIRFHPNSMQRESTNMILARTMLFEKTVRNGMFNGSGERNKFYRNILYHISGALADNSALPKILALLEKNISPGLMKRIKNEYPRLLLYKWHHILKSSLKNILKKT